MYPTARQRAAALLLFALVLVGTAAVVWRGESGAGQRRVGEAGGERLSQGRAEGGSPGAGGPSPTGGEAGGPAPRQSLSEAEAYGVAKPGREAGRLVVHVVGSVARAGVYDLPAGSRVVDALAAAGGPAAGARPDLINLAAPLEDGQRVYVPSEKDARTLFSSGAAPWEEVAAGGPGGGGAGATGRPSRVDVNRAGVAELDTLPGIGPSLERRIVDYRQAHGPFRRVEDLLRVPGIGPSKLEQLRPHVTLR